jgi:hypothetical protein
VIEEEEENECHGKWEGVVEQNVSVGGDSRGVEEDRKVKEDTQYNRVDEREVEEEGEDMMGSVGNMSKDEENVSKVIADGDAESSEQGKEEVPPKEVTPSNPPEEVPTSNPPKEVSPSNPPKEVPPSNPSINQKQKVPKLDRSKKRSTAHSVQPARSCRQRQLPENSKRSKGDHTSSNSKTTRKHTLPRKLAAAPISAATRKLAATRKPAPPKLPEVNRLEVQ